ncbi:MAG: hypothetical protein KDB03_10000 [Planctomycetales bacterium]|nr:hypothetical protein [Planctomycetales bacterium]
MAKCDEGYICQICGEDVSRISDSVLYLQYVVGWISVEVLHSHPESHIRCQPSLAQFIETSEFSPPVVIDGAFDRRQLDPQFAAARTLLLTQGFLRLLEIERHRPQLTVPEYPLESIRNSN